MNEVFKVKAGYTHGTTMLEQYFVKRETCKKVEEGNGFHGGE